MAGSSTPPGGTPPPNRMPSGKTPPPSQTLWGRVTARIKQPFKKVLIWGIFNVAVGMLPFWFVFVDHSLGNTTRGITSFLIRGELLIIVVAITADAIGEVMLRWRKVTFFPRLLIISGSFLLILWAAYAFARISTGDANLYNESHVVLLSWRLFISSVVLAAFTKVVVEL
jgi:hypothetical protein